MNDSLTYRPWLFWLTVVVTLMCLLMIAAGGMVTSMDAGDAVPDWPLSYGSLMPPMVGNVFWEHGHRLVGMALGLATIILTVTFARTEPRKWVRTLGYIALPAVCFQGLLGGFRVKLISSPWVQEKIFADPTGANVETFRVGLMMVHTTLAQCVLCLFAVIALVTSRHWLMATEGNFCRACGYDLRGATKRSDGSDAPCPECGLAGTGTPVPKQMSKVPKLALVTAITVVIQLLLGALRRHTDGTIIFHAVGAFVVAVHILALSRKILVHCAQCRVMVRMAVVLLVALALQLGLGLGSWLLTSAAIEANQAPRIAGSPEWASALISAHVAIGAIMLSGCVLLIVEGRRVVSGSKGGTSHPADAISGGGSDRGGVVTA
ncbi:MAG: cytochrome oxidase assembly protein [Phycisphaerae bacterium]|nr:MAG: cytochrome oxidase assembly protein [Phycisphaerae bacterium]